MLQDVTALIYAKPVADTPASFQNIYNTRLLTFHTTNENQLKIDNGNYALDGAGTVNPYLGKAYPVITPKSNNAS